MFIVAVLFLAGLVFAVQTILLQYSDIDRPQIQVVDDSQIIGNINRTFEKLIYQNINCPTTRCLLFNGTGSAEIAAGKLFDKEFSVSAWIKPEKSVGNIVSREGSFALSLDRNVTFSIWNSGLKKTYSTGADVLDGRLHHLLATLSPEHLRVYVDGAQAFELKPPDTPDTSAANLSFARGFFGHLDEVALYNVSLPGEQAAQLYAQESNMSAANLWPLDRQDNVARDTQGFLDGVIINGKSVEGFDCGGLNRKLVEADDFIRKSFKGQQAVAITYSGTSKPAIDCEKGFTGGKFLAVELEITSAIGQSKTAFRY